MQLHVPPYDHLKEQNIRSSLHKLSCFRILQFSQAMENKRVEGTRASLQTLPLKLQWKIFELLDYPSALSLSNMQLHSLRTMDSSHVPEKWCQSSVHPCG
jgi:hypothetical protein